MPTGIKKDGTKLGFQKGHPSFLTEDIKKKISKALIGNNNGFQRGHKDLVPSKSRKIAAKKISISNTGRKYPNRKSPPPMTAEHKKKISLGKRGKKLSLSKEARRKLSESRKGDKHWNWKGGVSQDKRTGIKYVQWRSDVFQRDNWTCQTCQARGGVYLEAHHIKDWVRYPKLRFEINNGITLCSECHKLTPNYKGKTRGYYNL